MDTIRARTEGSNLSWVFEDRDWSNHISTVQEIVQLAGIIVRIDGKGIA